MLQIKFNNIFLDLAPGETAEMERKSPLFSLENTLAEYSTPIKFAATERNAKALGYYFFEQTRRTKKIFDIQVFDQHGYRFDAKLVVEAAGMNSYQDKGYASGYLLTNISGFFTTIKNKKLKELSLGGIRSYSFTTFDPTDGSGGYWQHFYDTWNFTEDYVMLPCRNESWFGSETIDLPMMNMLGEDGFILPYSPVVPFTKLEFILNSIFTEHGWTLDTSALADTDWKKLILFAAKAIVIIRSIFYRLRSFTPQLPANWQTEIYKFAEQNLTYSLGEFMPDYTISEFFYAICGRYGWVPLCDQNTRTCKLFALKEIGKGQLKDWTKYASPASDSVIGDDRSYSFKNTFEGEDSFPSKPDFSPYKIGIPVQSKNNLPGANNGFDDTLIYTFLENQYYRVALDETTLSRYWEPFSDNIYDEEQEDANVTFDTLCTTLPVYWTEFRKDTDNNQRYILLPICKQSQYEKIGIKTLMYHGKVFERKADGTAGIINYPFASSVNTLPDGTQAATWSNVFKHVSGVNDYGIINYWFKPWLNAIADPDEITRNIYLPLHELLNFQWNDKILIGNICYLIKSYTEPLGYSGMIKAVLVRYSNDITVIAAPQAIYVRLAWRNISAVSSPDPRSWKSRNDGDLYLEFFSDAAATTPLTVSNLPIGYTRQYPGSTVFNYSLTANGTETFLGRLVHDGVSQDDESITMIYNIIPSPAYNII